MVLLFPFYSCRKYRRGGSDNADGLVVCLLHKSALSVFKWNQVF